MNIWYINPYSGGPGLARSYRPFYLAREWNLLGLKATVISSGYHHLLYRAEEAKDSAIIGGVSYLFIKTNKYSGNGLGRVWNMLCFSVGLLKLLSFRGQAEAPNVVIYSSPHLFGVLPAKLLAMRYKAKFILEVRDIWPMSLVQLAGASRFHPFVIVNGVLEKASYLLADKIVGLPSNLRLRVLDLLSNPPPVMHVGNGFLASDLDKVNLCDEIGLVKVIRKLRSNNSVIAIYGGAHGEPNALSQFISAAKKLKDQGSKIVLVFVGEGGLKPQLQLMAKDFKLDNVLFIDAVKKNELYAAYLEVDMAFLGWLDKPIYRYGISPNKLSEYMGFGLPVLHATSSDHDPIRVSGGGLSVGAGDVEQICKGFIELEKMGREARQRMGVKGREYVEEHYSYKKLACRYAELFKGSR